MMIWFIACFLYLINSRIAQAAEFVDHIDLR